METQKKVEVETLAVERDFSGGAVPCLSSNNGSDYEVRVLTTLEEIESIREFWIRVNKHPDADIDFYSLYVSIHAGTLKPYILVATQNGQPKAMLIGRWENSSTPLKVGYFTVFKLGLRDLVFLQDGFLGESSPEIAWAIVRCILKELKNGVADRAYFSNTNVDLQIYDVAQRAPGILFRDYSRKTAERWKTKLPANMDEFLKRRSKKHRYWLRRIGRVFEEAHAGKVKYKICQKEEEIPDFCTAAEEVAQTIYQRGLGVGFLNTAETHRRLKLAAEKGWLKAYIAFVGDEPVAFWCGRLYDGGMYLEWTGYKPAYRKYEAGTVLFLKMLEDLCSCGAGEVDYGTGTAGYKERFGDYNCVEGFVSLYAPTAKGLFANVLITLDHLVNKTAKTLASKLGVIDRIKKHWRGRLAGAGEKAAEPAGEAAKE
jgi:hypothetical protein